MTDNKPPDNMIDKRFKAANILIVDDKEANIDVLAGLLDFQGYTNVMSTTDPRLVVSLFKSFKPDLILLDLMMPHLTGYDVMRQLKELIPEHVYLPILVLTADISTEAKQRALSDGAKDFLSKPFDLIEVGLRIDNLLFARYLYQQLQNQNHILEEKVNERTIDLEIANVELLAARDKAEEGDRLKSAFLRNISHEIRTPLNGILGMYRVLADQGLSKQEKEEYYMYLRSSSDRLIKTVTDYMDTAMLVSGNMTVNDSVFAVGELLDDLYAQYRYSSESKKLTLTLQPSSLPDSFLVNSDRNLLRIALSQLIDNAIKFSTQGTVFFGYERAGTELEFFVKDTGVGISEGAIPSIFEYFIQENNSDTRDHDGSGLGLTIAQKSIEKIGGHIRLESVKGVGSVFYISIPLKNLPG